MESKLLLIIAALALAGTATFMAFDHQAASDMTAAFESFKLKHTKIYATAEEEAYRFAVYVANMNMINEHNNKNLEYTMAENKFADLTKEEFKSIYLGFKKPENKKSENVFDADVSSGGVNWVTEGKVQKVKDQGQCGSCWAFSTVASSESCDAIFGTKLGDFSEQQLVDCSGSYGNQGCNGGLMDQGFEYFIAEGICEESSYPYTARDGNCKASSCKKDSFKIKSYTDVSEGSTTGLEAACDKRPVSIAVDAEEWSFYSGGIFSNCGKSLDHGVLLAGYTSEYWLVKNSWGESWGEDGYIRLKSGNTCGLANSASYPTI